MTLSNDEQEDRSSEDDDVTQLKKSFIKESDSSTLLVNTALGFIHVKLQSMPLGLTVKLAAGQFTANAMKKAKNMLWEDAKKNDYINIIGEFKKRRDTSSRAAVEAHADDLANALQKLDLAKRLPNIAVKATELMRVPSLLREKTASPSRENGIFQRKIASLEESMAAMCCMMEDMQKEMRALRHECNALHQEKILEAQQNRTKQQYTMTSSQRQEKHRSSFAEVTSHAPKANGSQIPMAAANLDAPAIGKSRPIPDSDKSKFQDETDKDGFKIPKHVLEKRKKRSQKTKIITGKNPATGVGGLKGAPVDLFVYRVAKEAKEDDLRQLVTEKGCQVQGIELMSNKEAKFKSFKLSIPVAQMNTVFCDSFPWPEGVKVRRFIPPRRKFPQTTNPQLNNGSQTRVS